MTKEQIFNNCEIKIFDKTSLCIQNKEFMFAYNEPDSIVKSEFKGMYRNFGGLQSERDRFAVERRYLQPGNTDDSLQRPA